jgi:uncharacterized protein (DUF2147 family)
LRIFDTFGTVLAVSSCRTALVPLLPKPASFHPFFIPPPDKNAMFPSLVSRPKGRLVSLLILFVFGSAIGLPGLQAQQSGAILGEWLNADEDAKVTIYQEGDRYFGKVSWLKNPKDDNGKPRVDEENPKSDLRSRPIMGLVLLQDFRFDDGEWKGGSIYDPKNGKTYDCYMALREDGRLKIRGFVMGMRALGRTTYWTR